MAGAALPPWAVDRGIAKWTMQGTDTDVERALRRQHSAFEDERAALIRRLRSAEGRCDQLTLELQAAQERIEELEEQLLDAAGGDDADDDEEDGAAAPAAGRAAAEAAAEARASQALRARVASLEAVNAELREQLAARPGPPSSGLPHATSTSSTALATQEEMEFLRAQLNEAEEQLAALQGASESGAELAEQLAAARADAAAAVKAREALTAELAALRGELREARAARQARDADRGAAAEAQKELVAAKAQLAAARRELAQAQQQCQALDRDLRKAAAAHGSAQQENQELRAKVARLEQEVREARGPPQQHDPKSPEVRARAARAAGDAARRMVGKYDPDYQILYQIIYDYEQEVTRLKNETMSLSMIVQMREQDVGDQLKAEFAKERNELLGRITALEMRGAQ